MPENSQLRWLALIVDSKGLLAVWACVHDLLSVPRNGCPQQVARVEGGVLSAFGVAFLRASVCLQIKENKWVGKDGSRSVTQYHDVMGAILGRWAKALVMVRSCC